MGMIMSFARNDQSARSLDGGTYITKSGAYIGKITQAAVGVSDNGAQYIEMAFKENDGRVCFSRLFLTKKDGTESFGRKILDALLVVLNVQKADVVEGKVYTRDSSAAGGYRVDQGYRLPAIEGKPVGVVFQREEREYKGKRTYQMNFLTPFDPQTERVAKEILDGSEAKLLAERLKNLKDKDSTGQTQQQGAQQPPANHPAVDAPIADNEIPFD